MPAAIVRRSAVQTDTLTPHPHHDFWVSMSVAYHIIMQYNIKQIRIGYKNGTSSTMIEEFINNMKSVTT